MGLSEPPSTFGKYKPIAKLGQGGMARVFLALSAGPGGFHKLVVLKEILEEFADQPAFVGCSSTKPVWLRA
jgi:serine/threonine-protein kinase